jgi:hypothetical protein
MAMTTCLKIATRLTSRKCILSYSLCSLAILLNVIFARVARCAEGGQFAGPIGGSDIRVALLPPGGLYAINFAD